MKKIIFLSMLLISAFMLRAQEFEVPADYSFESASDYAKYETDILNCIDWLESSPLGFQPEKRKDAAAFLLTWVSGSPDVSIELNEKMIWYIESNPELLVIFLGGWTRLAIQNPADGKDVVKGSLAGIESVLKVYKKGVGVADDKQLNKLIKIQAKGGLEKWVAKQVG